MDSCISLCLCAFVVQIPDRPPQAVEHGEAADAKHGQRGEALERVDPAGAGGGAGRVVAQHDRVAEAFLERLVFAECPIALARGVGELDDGGEGRVAVALAPGLVVDDGPARLAAGDRLAGLQVADEEPAADEEQTGDEADDDAESGFSRGHAAYGSATSALGTASQGIASTVR